MIGMRFENMAIQCSAWIFAAAGRTLCENPPLSPFSSQIKPSPPLCPKTRLPVATTRLPTP